MNKNELGLQIDEFIDSQFATQYSEVLNFNSNVLFICFFADYLHNLYITQFQKVCDGLTNDLKVK